MHSDTGGLGTILEDPPLKSLGCTCPSSSSGTQSSCLGLRCGLRRAGLPASVGTPQYLARAQQVSLALVMIPPHPLPR